MLPSLPRARPVMNENPDATTCGAPPPGGIRNTWAVPGTNGKPVSCPTYKEPSGARTTDVGTGSTGIIVPGGGGGAPGMAGAGAGPNGRGATSGDPPPLPHREVVAPAAPPTTRGAPAAPRVGLGPAAGAGGPGAR